MVRMATYIIILTTVFSGEPFFQFFKIPVLFQHFEEHQQIDQRVTFFTFLSMHYWGDDMQDNDDDRDNQLPFKSDTIIYPMCTDITPHIICLTQPPLAAEIVHFPKVPSYHPNAHLDALFRPPKA